MSAVTEVIVACSKTQCIMNLFIVQHFIDDNTIAMYKKGVVLISEYILQYVI